mmetsp:Transcript_10079/g.13098  ORF Transcript_10079/g.13098 Transcript_10079/m.13098 type:complete len:95 (+) Transcript_10079:130-414(+)
MHLLQEIEKSSVKAMKKSKFNSTRVYDNLIYLFPLHFPIEHKLAVKIGGVVGASILISVDLSLYNRVNLFKVNMESFQRIYIFMPLIRPIALYW